MSLLNDAESLLTKTVDRLRNGETAETLRRELFGKNGSFSILLRQVGTLSPEERASTGSRLGEIRNELSALVENQDATQESTQITVDPTVAAYPAHFGSVHPLSAMIERMVDIFARLSFEVVEGPELVTDIDNFENLNLGPDHPARDGHDSFYLNDSLLLRTQTTAYQVIEMRKRLKNNGLPMRVVIPGKCYRRESDPTHSVMFHQIDAVVVDTQTTFSDLKGCLDYFIKELFGQDVETRFRTHHFPFTEPSAELDIRWKGGGKRGEGKHTGWLEMGGCGMIHPAVLKRAGINPKTHQGWAFGMSIERPVMVKYGVPDLRRMYENALPFLDQFN